MKYKISDNVFGRVYQFPKTIIPPAGLFLECGKTYQKYKFLPNIYNLFPFDTEQLEKTINPYMTGLNAPTPFTVATSSYGQYGGNGDQSPVKAFNSTWYTGLYGTSTAGGWGSYYAPQGGSKWPQWIELNWGINKELFLTKFIFHFQSAVHLTEWNIEVFNDSKETSSIIYDKNDVSELSTEWHSTSLPIGHQNYFGNRFRFNLLNGTRVQHWPMIAMIRLETVTYDDYLNKTDNFIVPAPTNEDLSYKSYIYIGTENNFKDLSRDTFKYIVS